MKMTEEQKQYINDGLTKAIQDIRRIKEQGPDACITEIEKVCKDLVPIVDMIHVVLGDQIEY